MLMIEKIANELGLELGQEFTIHEHRYKFTKDGLFWYDTCGQDWFLTNDTLRNLIIGNLNEDLIKTKWKPKYGDKYYFPHITVNDNDKVDQYTWNNDVIDNYLYNNNFICKTEKEAEKLHDYIIEKVKEYKNAQNRG